MSVFDLFHHDHINTPVNTPLITPFELQMVGRVSHENWGGGYNLLGGLDKSLRAAIKISTYPRGLAARVVPSKFAETDANAITG